VLGRALTHGYGPITAPVPTGGRRFPRRVHRAAHRHARGRRTAAGGSTCARTARRPGQQRCLAGRADAGSRGGRTGREAPAPLAAPPAPARPPRPAVAGRAGRRRAARRRPDPRRRPGAGPRRRVGLRARYRRCGPER
jgi:hypothetical protein